MKVLLVILLHLLTTILCAPLWFDQMNIGAHLGTLVGMPLHAAAEEAVVVETAVAGVIAEGIVQAGGLAAL